MVCGMGGSAIGADLAAAALGDRLLRPMLTVGLRAAELGDPGVGRALLQLLGRYRGDPGLLRRRRGARRPPHSRQHRRPLVDDAREPGLPVIGPPGIFQPRAAVAYMFASAARPPRSTASPRASTPRSTPPPLPRPSGGAAGPRRRGRRPRSATAPGLYGAGLTAPVAAAGRPGEREREDPAFYAELPEADHNEICGWTGGPPDASPRSCSRTPTSIRASAAASS